MTADHGIQYMKITKLHVTVQGTLSVHLKSQPRPNLHARSSLCLEMSYVRHSMASGKNNNTVHIEKDKLFWLTQSNCVWADIAGDNKAQEYLLEKLGDMANTPNVYDQNKDLIHSHFHPNRLPSELNQILGVQTKMSDPTFHTLTQQDSTEEEQHVGECSHLPIILDTDEEEQL